MNRAVFIDRDGVINELIYYPEQGIIDSPFTADQFRLIPGVCEAINKLHKMGFKIVVVSNQPGVAKGYFSQTTFDKIRERMKIELAKKGAFVDAEYYCFHHPEAKVEGLKANCECRKPNPGLLLQAARDMGINLSQSWMIGDGLTDVKAGKGAGTRTILLGRIKCELCHLMDEEDARPDFVVPALLEAAHKICEGGGPKSEVREDALLNPRPRTSDIGLRTSDIGLRTSDIGLRTSDIGLRTSDIGLRTSDLGHRPGAIQKFEDIDAWKEARKLANLVYDISEKGDFANDFSLRNQIRGAALSMMSNIAEGFDSGSDREFTQFLVIARASASEMKSQLHIALDRGYIGHDDFIAISQQSNSVISLLNGFIRYLKKPRPRTSDLGPRT